MNRNDSTRRSSSRSNSERRGASLLPWRACELYIPILLSLECGSAAPPGAAPPAVASRRGDPPPSGSDLVVALGAFLRLGRGILRRLRARAHLRQHIDHDVVGEAA